MKDGEGAGQDVGQEEVTEGKESDSDAEVLLWTGSEPWLGEWG